MGIIGRSRGHGDVYKRRGTGLVARVLKKGEEVEDGRNRYVSHFVTCPQRKKWRTR